MNSFGKITARGALVATFISLGVAACGGEADDGGTGGGSALSYGKDAGGEGGEGGTAPEGGGSVVPEASPEAGPEAAAEAGTFGSFVMDGVACNIEQASLVPVEQTGWQMTLAGSCPDRFQLTIAGVNDAAYPQTNVSPLPMGQGAELVLGSLGGPDLTGFSASTTPGKITITAGPTSTAPSRVTGTATVFNEDIGGVGSHELAYDIPF
jgi:hypothetical protein